MAAKSEIARHFQLRRGLSEGEAAVYLSLSPTKFRNMVADGRMPQPRVADSRLIWDIEELDLAFKSLPRRGDEGATTGGGSGDSWEDFQ